MVNKEITLQFVRGIILQTQGTAVDWIEFVVARKRYRTEVRVSKEKTVGKFSDDVGCAGAKVSILGKKRCLATTPPTLFKLTLKEEVCREEEMAKKPSYGGA